MDGYREFPEETSMDKAHTIAKWTIGTLPFVGSLAAEFFGMVVSKPLEARRDEWLANLYYDIKVLEQKSELFNNENLSQNPQFISTVTVATQIAIRTHQQEKLEALRNAVINSVIQEDTNYQQSIFLNLIDAFNPLHILAIQDFYKDEGKHFSYPGESTHRYKTLHDVEININSICISKKISPVIINDLINRSLIDKASRKNPGRTSIKDSGLVNSFDLRINDFGKAFYHYITSPNF